MDGSQVHCTPVHGVGARLCPGSIASGTPQAFPLASSPANADRLRSSPTTRGGGCALHSDPYPPDLSRYIAYGVSRIGSSRTPFRVACRTGLSGSARPSRRCQDCSHPPRRFPDQAVLSFTSQLRLAGGRALSSLSGVAPSISKLTSGYSASWRTHSSITIEASRRCRCGVRARPVVACQARATTSDPTSRVVSSPSEPFGMRTRQMPPSRT